MNDVTTQLRATDFQNSTSTFQFQISFFHHKKTFLGVSDNFS